MSGGGKFGGQNFEKAVAVTIAQLRKISSSEGSNGERNDVQKAVVNLKHYVNQVLKL